MDQHATVAIVALYEGIHRFIGGMLHVRQCTRSLFLSRWSPLHHFCAASGRREACMGAAWGVADLDPPPHVKIHIRFWEGILSFVIESQSKEPSKSPRQ